MNWWMDIAIATFLGMLCGVGAGFRVAERIYRHDMLFGPPAWMRPRRSTPRLRRSARP